eukprot:244450-Rhodomonas_salina.3
MAPGEIYVHQRSPEKSMHGSFYDMFVGGLVLAAEAVPDAARYVATQQHRILLYIIANLPIPSCFCTFNLRGFTRPNRRASLRWSLFSKQSWRPRVVAACVCETCGLETCARH